MPLSIRNLRAERLAREVASACGETITQTIISALEERLDRIRSRKRSADIHAEIMDISRRSSAIPDRDRRSPDEILGYDKNGV